MARIPLAIAGAAGRMGRELVRAIAASDDLALAGGTERTGAKELGQDAGEIAMAGNLGAALTSDVATAAANAQAGSISRRQARRSLPLTRWRKPMRASPSSARPASMMQQKPRSKPHRNASLSCAIAISASASI